MSSIWGVNNVKDGVELAASVVTVVTLVSVFLSYFLSRRQIHFSVMEKCVKDYRNFRNLSKGDEKNDAYVELVNEELFYMENNYLPFDVAVEWLDGMIDYLPFITHGEVNITKCQEQDITECQEQIIAKCKEQIIYNELEAELIIAKLKSYPRLKKLIVIKEKFNENFMNVYSEDDRKNYKARTELLICMISSLDLGPIDKWQMKRAIATR